MGLTSIKNIPGIMRANGFVQGAQLMDIVQPSCHRGSALHASSLVDHKNGLGAEL